MRSIKIGTRNSPLALWQAREVARHLQNLNYKTEITPIVSSGDKQLDLPLYAMGITGVFTRDLDLALLNGEIDIAVHSLKDVPTLMPEKLRLVAFLQRDYPKDILVRSSNAKDKPLDQLTIATSSLRRRAFWSKQFPQTTFTDIRGNVQTRLRKISEGLADATLFSQAAIERLHLDIEYEELPQMLPAPAQGVVVVAGHEDHKEINAILSQINHLPTEQCVTLERDFLNTLEGGCTAPIGAYAETIDNGKIRFLGRLCSLDGKRCLEIEQIVESKDHASAGKTIARKMLTDGGHLIMEEIKQKL
ncbi:hydroxymethylbilane synthase [Bergeyella sp. RCAD1439]|uniref:hydroxymethylbilane synthase n=1 Tax=Bergeyella anatis TaxID=3113737 RepID=UPI002E1883CB|nr:hydroxymethylbilane synthase [Bergeyella sp. RCAD1439]